MSLFRYRFAPTQLNSVSDIARFINDNLRRVSDALINLEEPTVPSYTSQPNNPQEGSIAIADGTGWDPGQGAGTYIYRAGQWRRID